MAFQRCRKRFCWHLTDATELACYTDGMSIRRLFLILVFCLAAGSGFAQDTEVHAVALFNGKAMLSINGAKAKILKVGDTYKGVTLTEASTSQATVTVNGVSEELTLNGAVTLSGALGATRGGGDGFVQLWEDDAGFFRAQGAINGRPLEFLVDTGANLVVISSAHASRIGLEYKSGQQAWAATASGRTPMYVLEADEISFDDIKLDSILMGVIEGNYPLIPLLGMSFLERVDMNRSGNMMTLRKRF